MFFFDGQTTADVTEVYVTEKSNGENAKLGLRRLDGELYLLVRCCCYALLLWLLWS